MKRIVPIICILIFVAATMLSAQNSVPQTDSLKQDYAPLQQLQYQQLAEMLSELQLTTQDLNFEKDWDLSTWGKGQKLLKALQEPYQGLDLMKDIRENAAVATTDEGLARMVDKLQLSAYGSHEAIGTYLTAYSRYEAKFRREVKQPKDIFRFYENSLRGFKQSPAAAFSDLNYERWSALVAYLISAFIEPEDKEAYKAYYLANKLPETDSLKAEDIKDYMNSIYEPALMNCAMEFLALSQVIKNGAVGLNYKNKKPLIKKGEFGTMIIGTNKDDVYDNKHLSSPLCLLIDPDGDDRYLMQLNTAYNNYYYLLLDIKGDDSYLNSEIGAQFFSNSGIGVSFDLAGNDVYRTGDFSFAALLGVNVHVDSRGRDIYDSGLFSQGAAIRGVSLLCDLADNDSYRATTMAQGFGSVRAAGALLDFSGADTYDLGGKYTHAPLMPNDFRSMGQGMGFGFRPEYAGGLGLLYDAKGNDHYLGGVYAQGVGYWYAMGMLIDEAGNDVYNAIYYPQGSGIHLASGMLYDGGGDDAYYSRNGPGQGAGHDWGLGILIDHSGNDAYSIQGGNGLGLSNSVGIFVDKSGDDRYERNEAQNYGSAAFSRSTGSIGLFWDGEGKDSYPDSTQANGITWKKGTYGIGRDIASNAEIIENKADELIMAEPPAEDAPIAEIFAAAAEWEVGSAVTRVKTAREFMLKRAAEAGEYIVANKLDTNSGLEYRALEALTKGSPEFKTLLFDFVDDADSIKAKNSMALIAGEQDSTLIVPISRHLQNKKYITACLSLLGSIKSQESVEILSQFAFHPSERYRYIVARSLRQIGTDNAKQALENMSGDSSFLVKALIRKYREDNK